MALRESLLTICDISVLLIALVSSNIKFASSSLFFIIVLYFSCTNFFFIEILTIKEAWFEEYLNSGKI